MPYRAFVSSTFIDLKEHRAHVISSLRRAGFFVDPMEDWTADSDEPKQFSQDRLDGCDLCVLLVAFRRGYVPDGETLSITQLEYEAALKRGIDILPLMLEEDAPWWAAFDGRNNDPEITQWRSELRKRHGVQPFNLEPHSIDMTGAIGRWLTKRNNLQQEQKPTTETRPEVPTKITWDIEKHGSPYPGLLHFSRRYSPVFFGRDDEIREVLYRMQKPEGRFIIVSGDSGVGKSSLVDAGILPKLEDGALPGGEPCLCVRMVPGQANQPFDALMTALGLCVTRAGLRPDTVTEDLKRSPESFAEQIRKIISGGTDGKQLVLFVDQMEELFTAQDVGESNKFLTHLYRAAQEKALWVIATIRSDHLHFCHRHHEMLGVLKGSGHYPLGPVAPFMMTDMIVKPAQCAGLTVSDAFARRIVSDTLAFRNLENSESDTANLPLLAFVLDRLFQNRVNHSLSEEAYKTMGGVSGAIAEHVDAVEKELRQLNGAKAGDRLAQIFHSLVIVKEEGLPTRNRPLLADFPLELRPSVNMLVNARLLRTEGEGDTATVSVSHEKLFEAWPALRDYISENKKGLMDQTLLRSRARKWADMGKPWFSWVASGRELKDFRQAGVPTSEVTAYLNASHRAWWIKAFLAISLVLISLVIVRAWQQGMSVEYTWLKLKSTFAQIHIERSMIDVSAGPFRMVDVQGIGDKDAQSVRDVTISKRFKLGRHEVTFEEYDRFVLATGKPLPTDQGCGRGDQPVINVSWEDARNF